MGVREFNAITTVTVQQSSHQSSPDHWDPNDRWGDEQRRKFRGY